MDTYETILKYRDSIVTPYHLKIWQYSFDLEQFGALSHTQAEKIRNDHLTTAWDPSQRKLIDLLDPQNPRQIVKDANRRFTQASARFFQEAKKKLIKSYTGALPEEIMNRPEMMPLYASFPDLFLGNTQFCIYGKTGGPSFWLEDWAHGKMISVSPDYYGLPTQMLHLATRVYGIGLYPASIGTELIYGCFEIIAQEHHFCFSGVAQMIKSLIGKDCDLTALAKDFILGQPEPMLLALENANHLAPAMLSFLSPIGKPDGSDINLPRIYVIRSLDI